jgi:predicted oxidoreductase
VVAVSLDELVDGMNRLTPEPMLALADVRRAVEARDAAFVDAASSAVRDGQADHVRAARRYPASGSCECRSRIGCSTMRPGRSSVSGFTF